MLFLRPWIRNHGATSTTWPAGQIGRVVRHKHSWKVNSSIVQYACLPTNVAPRALPVHLLHYQACPPKVINRLSFRPSNRWDLPGIWRQYGTKPPPPGADDVSSGNPSSDGTPQIPPSMWIEVLENTANAPWVALERTEQDKSSPEEKMKRAYSRTFQIFMYLGRPQEEPEVFLDAFEKSVPEPGTQIARARGAIAVLARSAVRDLVAIPLNSPFRSQHPKIFDLVGALIPLHDEYIADGKAPEQPAWSEFWSKAQLTLLGLGLQLDEEGFGFKEGE